MARACGLQMAGSLRATECLPPVLGRACTCHLKQVDYMANYHDLLRVSSLQYHARDDG